MIICIDVGNTNIKYALFDGDELRLSFRVATEHKKTSDEYGGQIISILKNSGICPQDIGGGIISSVVPPLDYTIERMCRTYLKIKPLMLAPGLKTGLNITDRVIENFLVNVPYDGTLKTIIDQKYVALFWVGFEAWADYRRTGYPELVIGTGTFNDHILPRRLVYPTNTMETNRENYEEALSRLRSVYGGDDDMKTPLWWSQEAVKRGIR